MGEEMSRISFTGDTTFLSKKRADMRHDLVSDVFSTVKNAEFIGKNTCVVPASNLIKDILKVVQENKYIGDFEYIDDGKGGKFSINLIGKINNCNSVSPRYSVRKDEIIKYEKRYLPAENVGILIVSTPKGVMDQKKAKKEKTGGKLLGFVF